MTGSIVAACGDSGQATPEIGPDPELQPEPEPEPEPEPVELADTRYDPRPQEPTILRDVAMIDDEVQWTHPFVPGHRTTMDGRVAIRVQGGSDEVSRLNTNLSFFLFVPERIDEPIVSGPRGARILAEPEPFDVRFPPALGPDVFRLGHHAICDPTQEFEEVGERTNPYTCGANGRSDCYDLVIISSTSPGFGAQLWGTPVTVEVEQPKTRDARLVDVVLGEPVKGAYLPLTSEWTEPAVTVDGRLLTGRLGRVSREWTHPETGQKFIRPYDLAYSVLPSEAEPCDVTGWTAFHPLSHAPFDPQMVGTYGLAAYPFRDTEGNPIPDGEDMGGTYPWVDREGANVFMAGVHGRIAEQSEEAFPRRCVHDGCEQLTENIDFDRGYMVAGLWTHGKLVHLDGLINSIDWAVGVTPQAHWMVDLYVDAAGTTVPVRFGSGRFIEQFRDVGPYPPGYTHNANILDSLQNLPNWRPQARTVTPRDVVWVMSTGVATDEVAFDELLDPAAIIVSNMQASITQLYDGSGRSMAIPHQHNGQVRVLTGAGLLTTYELQPNEVDEIHLQNGATSLRYEVPAYGRVEAGTARVEPVALGGVEGRGLWLSGDAAIHYELASQPELEVADLTIGIFVDDRAAPDEARELLRFSDDTGIVLRGDTVIYVRGHDVVHEVSLPPSDGWMHLGWQIDDGHRSVTLRHDGFALDRFETDPPIFALGEGDLVVGRQDSPWTGFRGWVDDFVVLAHTVNEEVACNHARGTLVEVGDTAEATLRANAEQYPAWAHAEVAEAAGVSGSRFACIHDYTADHAVRLDDLPRGTVSLREAINFPEGPLRFGVPRPDSSGNSFCLGCHTSEGRGGLGLDALVADPSVPAEHDRRRQPSQPPRRVFGNIPPGWIPPGSGPGSPDEATQAPPEGLLVDEWLLPGAP
ncbi:hypothetical protein [Paraliomyxa miuraensis]|uniref:hypothetical protein n=1 Tax=Paraliomyxa miuraensis TaxID=376150 RepID=UPI00225B13BC|nr:hypothetical protein [Paraliomyxa miuraensis]MCX4247203.1 hypothetical protein [Paraliomyxa miuraensis]